MGNLFNTHSGNSRLGVSKFSIFTLVKGAASILALSSAVKARRRVLVVGSASLLMPMAGIHAATINLANPVSGQVTDFAVYYDFNQNSGTSVSDSSGLNINGTINQAQADNAPSWATGVNLPGTSNYGNGLKFNNPDFDTVTKQGYVSTATTGATSPLNLSNTSFTIGMWLKMDSINSGVVQTGWLLDKKGGSLSNGGWALILSKTATDIWSLTLRLDNASAISTTFSTLNDLAWHHLGVSYDVDTNGASFYVDGQIIATQDNKLAGLTNNGIGLMVGQRNLTNANVGTAYNMEMDDLFVATSVYSFAAVPEPSAVTLVTPALGIAMFFGWRKFASRN